eukprot:CAMPEP_0113469372 /NCGR_PEP_ID=MMETSP0014_2-20120614/15864_1 /TAXON_ID=2857 /ORGANISM="Nitzschia sp." /LENGTH=72 /DNA_ID=CAMNT_0000361845 /DNA_START=84 /DNA_END=302 /DNA_ORIENTATION=+ /assembly_acc=CAM_ASM_000159
MPVPRRRNKAGSGGGTVATISPSFILSKMFDIDFMFQKSKTLLFYAFTPAVVYIGMTTEPSPASWFELINIF